MHSDRPRKMPVHEVFGPTIQGEGMVIGRKTMFVRTGGCDYSCAWCDSAFTWNGEEKADMMTATDVYLKLREVGGDNFNHVTISGGNPALIGQPMDELIGMLSADGIEIGLETQGSFWKDWFYNINDLTISPKPPSSTMKTNFDKLDEIIDRLHDAGTDFTLKVVIFNQEDFEYAKMVYKRYAYTKKPFYVSVGNEDPYEGGDISGRLLRDLDDLWNMVLNDPEANNFRPLPQLHTLVWANRREV